MIPLWLQLTLLSSFTLATSDALTKKALQGHNEYLVTWLRLLPALPLYVAPLAFLKIPRLGGTFYLCTLCALPLEAAAFILYTKALRLSPLSLTLPLLSLTPLIILAGPSLVLGGSISGTGGAGILLIVLGSYLLNLQGGGRGFLAPIASLISERGSRCMILVATIYSITSILGKWAIAASSPLFFASVYMTLLILILTPIALYKGRGELRIALGNGTLRATLLPALFYAVQVIAHVYAMSLAHVAYMIAVKRTSLLFGVWYGHLLFGERYFARRLLASLLMLCGVYLITRGG